MCGIPIASAVPDAAYGVSPVVDPRRPLKTPTKGGIMKVVTTRETVHALVDRYPDEDMPALAELLSYRRSANGTDLSAKAILARHGATPMSAENFELHFGDLPTDDEG
jgi:hypothetical protein